MSDNINNPRGSSGPGKAIAIVAIVAVLVLGVAWAAGFFNVDTSGSLEAPTVSVQGGEVPDVDVEAADIDVGTKTETIEVPTVSVTPPGEAAETDQ